MSEHLYTQRKTSERSASTLQHSPFQPHPFVVQPQTEEKSLQPDLKTALERAKRYGHSLDLIKFGAPPVQRPEPRIVQAKLTIGEPGDGYEQEANRVAAQVVTQIHTPTTQQSEPNQAVQRQEEPVEEIQAKPEITALQRQEEPVEEIQAKPSISEQKRSPLPSGVQREAMPEDEELQTKSTLQRREAITGGDASTDLESAINRARGGGQPLEAGLQRSMGHAMGADFSGVKVHTDAQADRLNRAVQARAFTTGQDVFFRSGEYNPGSRGGQELIAHELTHVVQQNGGVSRRQINNQLQKSDDEIYIDNQNKDLEIIKKGKQPDDMNQKINTVIKRGNRIPGAHQEIMCGYGNGLWLRFSRTNSSDTIQYFADINYNKNEMRELAETKNLNVTVKKAVEVFEQVHQEIPKYHHGDCQEFARRIYAKLTGNPDGYASDDDSFM